MANDTLICSQCNSTFNKMFLLGKQGNAETCPVCGGALVSEEEDRQKDWVTWWYYGFKSNDGKTTTLREQPINLGIHIF